MGEIKESKLNDALETRITAMDTPSTVLIMSVNKRKKWAEGWIKVIALKPSKSYGSGNVTCDTCTPFQHPALGVNFISEILRKIYLYGFC